MDAATVATTVMGGLWFTVRFGKAYTAALGLEYIPNTRPGPTFIVGPLVCSLVTIVTSALLMEALNLTSVKEALTFGAIVGVGYIVATMTNSPINPKMPHPPKYSAVCGQLVILSGLTTCLILVNLPLPHA